LILNFKVLPFSLDVKAPFQKKEGILLYAKTTDGKEAWAEISPLPGFSTETLEEVKKQVESLRIDILNGQAIFKNQKLFPSVIFGLESLFYTLSGTMIKKLTYPVCGFLNGNYEEIEKQIPFLIEEGYQHVKLKVSKLSLDEAHFIIRKLLGKVKLKIDINRSWSLEKSLSFFSKYPIDTFEYIEEPVDNVQDLEFFPYPIALDETLRENISFSFPLKVKALIIKPMLMGSLKSIEQTVQLSKKLKAQVVLSSSYESGVGLFHLCSFFERAKIPLYPLGVDTYRLLKQDLLLNPHVISKGMLHLSPLEVSYVSKVC